MRNISVSASAPSLEPSEAFARVRAVERYPQLCGDVLEVMVSGSEDDGLQSTWTVEFRDGILEWTEVDLIDEATRTMRFRLVDGDLEHFEGAWQVDPAGAGCVVTFTAEVDLGLASLGDIVDPMAQRSLEDSVAAILAGLLGSQAEILIESRSGR